MKIYYKNSTILGAIESKNVRAFEKGTQAEYFAYVLSTIQAYASSHSSLKVKKKFYELMAGSIHTEKLLRRFPLAKHFDFTQQDLAERLAKHLILTPHAFAASNEYPVCPFSKKKIKYGVIFAGDSNTYEISVIFNWIFNEKNNFNPLIKRIEEINQYDLSAKPMHQCPSIMKKIRQIRDYVETPRTTYRYQIYNINWNALLPFLGVCYGAIDKDFSKIGLLVCFPLALYQWSKSKPFSRTLDIQVSHSADEEKSVIDKNAKAKYEQEITKEFEGNKVYQFSWRP